MSETSDTNKRRSRARRLATTTVQTPMALLTVEDLAALMKLSESTIRRMVKDHEFPGPLAIPKDSKRPDLRWRLKDYEDWARRQMTQDDKIAA